MTSDIVGTLEIGQLLSVSRQRADQLTKTDPLFPRPAAELASGRVWDAESVRTWARFRNRGLSEGRVVLPRQAHDAIRGVTDAARLLLASPTKKSAQAALQEALEALSTTDRL
jgi:hypothetical protein